jgi:hypothetical protein
MVVIIMADLLFDLLYNTETGKKFVAIFEKYIELCHKHRWLGIISYLAIIITLAPLMGWFWNFLDGLLRTLSVLAILCIGGFISMIASIFK